MKHPRVDTSGGANPLAQNPFGVLRPETFAAGAPDSAAERALEPVTRSRAEPNRNRGRVDVIRQTAGRGGKTVTVLSGFKGISARELEELARTIRKASGVGGTVRSATIEIQGDQREQAETVLREAGFRPVRAGG